MRLIPLLVVLTAASATAEPRFDWMPRGHAWSPHSLALAVSDDGCTVGGELTEDPADEWAYTDATRWARGGFRVVMGGPGAHFVALSGDARVLVANDFMMSARWEDGTDGFGSPIRFTHVPEGISARALSRDGSVIVGNASLYAYQPARWLEGAEVPTALPTLVYDWTLQPLGLATDVSADGGVAVGWVQDYAGRYAARWVGSTLDILPMLPGTSESVALGISADGTAAIGQSGSQAVRWRDGTIDDLGPGEAFAATSDGSAVLIRDVDVFLWQASTGRRAVRELLETDFGAALAGWTGVAAHDISPDGRTLVGSAISPLGKTIGWRARRSDERCPQDVAWQPLLQGYPSGFQLYDGFAGQHATTPGGWLYVVDGAAGTLLRTRLPDLPGEWPEPLVPVLPIPKDPFTGYPQGGVLASTPADQVYVAMSPGLLFRVDADGSVTEVLDGSTFAPITGPDGTPITTAPGAVAVASDGTAFVAAHARALQVAPDGTVTELFDAAQAYAWSDLWLERMTRVARSPDGRLYWSDYEGDALLVTDASGAPLDAVTWEIGDDWELNRLADVAVDSTGDLWVSDGDALVRVTSAGVAQTVVERNATLPDGGTLYGIEHLRFGADGSLYFVGSVAGRPLGVYRRTGDGVLQQIYDGVLDYGPGNRFFSLTEASVIVAREMDGEPPWYSDTPWPQLIEVLLPPPPPACDDGLDSDGDGLVDLDDPGCLSALDTSERSPDLVCDNGLDDDGDGLVDFPEDPGCARPDWRLENPACSDGLDNDRDGTADWNGAAGLPADPECAGDPARLFEQGFCGLGYELGALAVGLRVLVRRLRRRRQRV